MASLTSMPELVMERILKHCDFRAVQTLRKVSHNLRDFVDGNKPDAKLDVIHLHVHDGYIEIWYIKGDTDYNRVTYRNQGTSCEIEWLGRKNRTTILNDSNYVDTFFNDFPIIFGFQASALQELNIREDSNQSRENPVYDATLRMLSSVLKSRKTRLQTDTLIFNVLQQHHMLSILPYIDSSDSNGLDLLTIVDPMSAVDRLTLELDEVVKLEQWNAARQTLVDTIRFPHNFENFEHFSTVFMQVNEMVVEDLECVKDKFFNSTTIKQFVCRSRDMESQLQFMRNLDFPTENADVEIRRAYFWMENSGDVLQIEWGGTGIMFRRIQESAVPEDITIWEFL